ncbi:hypothetical protein F1880_008785 [Penicillium rolfsii]|nr:hypothetical protein F1880_008785 [Penicillium rolfsii]
MRQYFVRRERNRYLPSSLVGHGFDGWLTTSLTDLHLVIEDWDFLSLILAGAIAPGQSLIGKLVIIGTSLAGVLLRDLNNPLPSRDYREDTYQVPLAVDVPTYKRTSPRDFVIKTAHAVNSDSARIYHLDIQLSTLATKNLFDTAEVNLGLQALSTYEAQVYPVPTLGSLKHHLPPAYQENDPLFKGMYTTNGIAIAIIRKSSVAEDEPDLLISVAPALFPEVWLGPNVATESELKNFIKRKAWEHRACCTDSQAVLDSDFRVCGNDGLRVVDTSVSPNTPSYNVVLSIYMISEKFAEVIIADVK